MESIPATINAVTMQLNALLVRSTMQLCPAFA
jgi:hypothetical protein